jgi:hypothetical protein
MLNAFSRLGMLSLFVLACLSMQPSSQAQEHLSATTVQDEPRKIPQDNIAFFNRADRKVRFQLVKMSGLEERSLAGSRLTIIDSSGAEKTILADESGVATLEDVEQGLIGLVVAGKEGHLAMPIALREEVESDEPADAPTPAVVKLAVTSIDPRDAVGFTSSYLPPVPTGKPEDIDSDFISNGSASPSLQYRIRLSDEGTLSGRVYSLLNGDASTAGAEGTNLAVYRGNRLVAKVVADNAGRYSIPDLTPGYYGILAAGPAGYVAFGFEAYDATSLASLQDTGETLVSTNAVDRSFVAIQGGGGGLPIVSIPPSMLPGVLDAIRAAGSSPESGSPGTGSPASGAGSGPGGAGPGGAGPGGAGPGGAGPGGAGLGGAGALGLLAAGGAAAAISAGDDNNDNNFVPPVVSPATAD